MNDKKNIDRLFQEKFRSFEVVPDDSAWENIERELHQKKPKRRVIPLWWWSGGAAAVLVLLLVLRLGFVEDQKVQPEYKSAGVEKTRSNETSSDKVSPTAAPPIHSRGTSPGTTRKQPVPSVANADTPSSPIDKDEPVASAVAATEQKSSAAPKATQPSAVQIDRWAAQVKKATEASMINPDDEINKSAFSPTSALAKKGKNLLEKQDTEAVKNEILNEELPQERIEDALAKAQLLEEDLEQEPREAKSRWNISPQVAPVYFNTLGKGSSIDPQFVGNGKSGEVNVSYGINGSYAVNDKIKVRAGINKVTLGYSTDGVMALSEVHSFTAARGGSLANVNPKQKGATEAYISSSNLSSSNAPQFMVMNEGGKLEQQLGYIEVPLEIEYNLIDQKIGLNLIGGFSTLFLDQNEVYSVMGRDRALIGDANNLNKTSYSANFGLGVNYQLSSAFRLNLEPMFKYQINTFNNTAGDFRPYFLGVYTGFSFKF